MRLNPFCDNIGKIVYLSSIHLTLNTRISNSKIQVPLFMTTCFGIKLSSGHFKCLPTK
jgi:hypothetical protein